MRMGVFEYNYNYSFAKNGRRLWRLHPFKIKLHLIFI